MRKPLSNLVGIVFILSLIVFVGCSTSQIKDTAIIGIDTLVLDDAITQLHGSIESSILTMPAATQVSAKSALTTMDNIRADLRSMIKGETLSNASPAKLKAIYDTSKLVYAELKLDLYDESEGFKTWNSLSKFDQLMFEDLDKKAIDLSKKIDSYFNDPSNENSLIVAKQLSDYGYLAYKILSIAIKN